MYRERKKEIGGKKESEKEREGKREREREEKERECVWICEKWDQTKNIIFTLESF